MAKVEWTPEAVESLEAICSFISRDSHFYALQFAERAIQAVENLKRFPRFGRVVPELNRENYREVIFGNYRIIYRVKGELVQILTVYHQARLLDPSDFGAPE